MSQRPAVYTIFRFLTGFSSSAFLSVAGGSVSDLFDNDKVSTYASFHSCFSSMPDVMHSPLAVYTVSPFIGPAVGPLISGYVKICNISRCPYVSSVDMIS